MIRDYLPRSWIVGNLQLPKESNVNELVSDSFDPLYSAITTGKIVSKYNSLYFSNIEDITYDRSSEIHIELEIEKPGILVLSESSYPGWQVFVDGQEKKCLWLNLLFQGVEVEKGRHRIDFIYRPKYFEVYLSVSMISLIVFVLYWFYYVKSARNNSMRYSKTNSASNTN
jgi:uncharacterized membrane protein YfhO